MTVRHLIATQNRVREAHDKLSEALAWLAKLKKHDEHYSLHVDAVVKRFETLFEYVWKAFKSAAEYQGVEAPGPRPAIQEAVRFGWIRKPELWTAALDARNGSVHDYFGMPIDEYLKIIRKYNDDIAAVLARLPSGKAKR